MDPDKLTTFRERFIARDDLYALQTKTDDRWVFLPRRARVTDEVLRRHLDGSITIGAYPSRESTTKWLVCDIDSLDETALRIVIDAFERREVPYLLEDSGRKGYHLWTFFSQLVPNALARRLGVSLAGPHEVFPKQHRTTADQPGNLIKLPLGRHRATNRRCSFLDTNSLVPVPDPWAVLAEVRLVTLRDLLRLAPPPRRRPLPPISVERSEIPRCVSEALMTGTCEGRRNKTALILACALFRADLSENGVLSELSAWNGRNSPPLGEREIASVVRSAARGRYRFSRRRTCQELGCNSCRR